LSTSSVVFSSAVSFATPLAVGAAQTASVSCPGGTFATGGGGITTHSGGTIVVALTKSNPTGNPPTGWTVSAEIAVSVLGSATVQAYAVCAP
jgi:hypothetical protein